MNPADAKPSACCRGVRRERARAVRNTDKTARTVSMFFAYQRLPLKSGISGRIGGGIENAQLATRPARSTVIGTAEASCQIGELGVVGVRVRPESSPGRYPTNTINPNRPDVEARLTCVSLAHAGLGTRRRDGTTSADLSGNADDPSETRVVRDLKEALVLRSLAMHI